MKKLYIYLAFLLSCSCENSFTHLQPLTSIGKNSFCKSESDIEAGVNAAYASLRGYYNNLAYAFSEVTTDNTYTSVEAGGSEESELDKLPLEPTYGRLNALWNTFYSTIARCNIILDKIDGVEMSSEIKNRRKGELMFLRAWAYFHLVRFWGEVPLTLSEIINTDALYTYKRESVENIYSAIVSDLNQAIETLPPIPESKGRIYKAAAICMLGEVYLTTKKYELAKETLGDIVTNASTYGLSLMNDFEDVFDPEKESTNTETIFSIQYKSGGIGTGSAFMLFFLPHSTLSGKLYGVSGGSGLNQVTRDLYDSFEDDDPRREMSIGVVSTDTKEVYYSKKFIDLTIETSTSDLDNDWIVYRFADVKLMYAEALNKTGNIQESLNQLNDVRRRVGLPDKTNLTQSELDLHIEQERRAELNLEGHRWFDLNRTDRLISVMNEYFMKEEVRDGGELLKIQPYVKLFPIPEVERVKTPELLFQNPGY